MNSSSLDLSQLLYAMDQAFIQQEPLPNHFIKSLDLHTRETYATMLAAVILVNGNPQANQARLFSLFCTALGLENSQSKAFHAATQIQQEHIQDFCHLAEEHGFAISFLTDSLIFSRLDAPINPQQNQLLTQWCALLQLPESHIQTAVLAAANTLGIDTDLNVDGAIAVDYFQVWSECLYRPVNIHTFKESKLNLGYWLIDQDIEVNDDIVLKNQVFKFSNTGKVTFNQLSKITIKDCHFINPHLVFNLDDTEKETMYLIESSQFIGHYDVKSLMTALAFKLHENDEYSYSVDLKINNNYFETHNAQAIRLDLSWSRQTIVFDSNEFKCCGNEHLPGGAIGVVKNINCQIQNTNFSDCKGFIGGALFTNFGDLYSKCTKLDNCHFYNCQAYYFSHENKALSRKTEALGGGAIWGENGSTNSIRNCVFTNSSIRLRTRGESSSTPFDNCVFKQVKLAAYREYGYGIYFPDNCRPRPELLDEEPWYQNNPGYKKPEDFTEFTYPMPRIWETNSVADRHR